MSPGSSPDPNPISQTGRQATGAPGCISASCPAHSPTHRSSGRSLLSRSGLLFLCLKPSMAPQCLQEQPQPLGPALGALSKLALAGCSVLAFSYFAWEAPISQLRLLQSLAALSSFLCNGSSLEFPLSLSGPRILEISEEHLRKQSHGNKCVSKQGGQ